MFIKIKNLDKYQHYKNCYNIVWIKWYVNSEDPEFEMLPASVRWCFVKLVCLACKMKNRVDYNIKWLQSKIDINAELLTVKEWIELLKSKNFIEIVYNNSIKNIYQNRIEKNRIEKNRIEKNKIEKNKTENNPQTSCGCDKYYELKKDPISKIVYAYKLKKGVDITDRNWDKIEWKRVCSSAKKLFDYFGDEKKAIECLDELANEFNNKGLNWKIETIVKNATDWNAKRNKNNNINNKLEIKTTSEQDKMQLKDGNK